VAKPTSVIRLVDGKRVGVPMGLGELRDEIDALKSELGRPRFLEVSDSQGKHHLININQIVAMEGPE
jgi:hypothetical protein